MPAYIAQIAPQRSTQYAALASTLAPYELQLSPLGEIVTTFESVKLGGQAYLKFDLAMAPDINQLREMDLLAMVSGLFAYYEKVGTYSGPFLRPVEPSFKPTLPPELISTRRYRGKTNELFTQFLCNIARYSSELADRPWNTLRVFDPLMGGATTLFAALILGASAAGVERDENDVNSTVGFLRTYLQEQRISHAVKPERLKQLGRRSTFTIGGKQAAKKQAGKTEPQTCILAAGDTVQSPTLIAGFRPHLIVTDLPYGIQHKGQLTDLLTKALPVWTELLAPSGALVFAWEAMRFPRADMIALVESASTLRVLNDAPYDQLSHRVDRVIKQRDVIVARPVRA